MAVIIAVAVELSDDEAYYWSWSLRPDWSYFDHPPLQAWITALLVKIFGKINLAVRMPALAGIVLSAWLFRRWLVRHRVEPQASMWLFLSAPILYVFSWMALPDVVMLPLALAVVDRSENRKWIQAGFFLGLTALAKWHAALLVPGLVIAIAFDPYLSNARKIGMSFAAGTVALALQIPVIHWNYIHGWAAFRFHLVDRHSHQTPPFFQAIANLLSFTGGFFLIAGVGLTYLVFHLVWRPEKWKSLLTSDYRILSWAVPFIGVFMLSATNGETRIYWTTFAIFPLLIFALKHAEPHAQAKFVAISKAGFPVLSAICFATLFLPIGAYFRPVIEHFRSYDLRQSPRGDLIGWKDWADVEIAEEQKDGKKVLFIASDFRLASQLLWNTSLKTNQVFSADNYHQYEIWPAPDPKDFSKAVFFGDNRRGFARHIFQKLCRHPIPAEEVIEVKYLDEVVKEIHDIECDDLEKDAFSFVFFRKTSEHANAQADSESNRLSIDGS